MMAVTVKIAVVISFTCVAVSVKVLSRSVSVSMEMYTVPDDTAQHIAAQQDQHKTDAELQR